MAGNIKGIVVEIGADTTKLGKAVGDVTKESMNLQSELKQVDKLLKFDPGNIELTTQKQQILTENIEATSKRLNILKDVQGQVQQQFENGDIGVEQYRAFQREIQKTESILKRLSDQKVEIDVELSDLEKAKSEVKELGSVDVPKMDIQVDTSDIDKAKSSIKELGNEIKDVTTDAAGAMGGIGALTGAGVGALVTEMSEYNTTMSRLSTNAEMAGRDVGIVQDAFKDLTSVTGEADAATETMSNLLATGFKDEELSSIVNQINGAYIQFSDTLKTEGIADGIQETLATGAATGPFAELLERSGQDLDAFDAKLAVAKQNGTETQLVLETMSKLGFGSITDKYKELNPEMTANAQANVELESAMGNLALTMTPLVTTVTNFITSVVQWANENPKLAQTIVVVASAIAMIVGACMAIAPVIITVTGIMGAFGGALTALAAGPILLIIAGIAAVAFAVYEIVTHWEIVSEFIKVIWNGILTFLSSTWEVIKVVAITIFNAIVVVIQVCFEAIKIVIETIWNAIVIVLSTIWNGLVVLVSTIFNLIVTIITTCLNAIFTVVQTIWNAILTVITTIINGIVVVATTLFNALKTTITTIFNTIKTVAQFVWNGIKTMIINPVIYIKNTVVSAFTSMKDIIVGIWEGITGTIKSAINAIIKLINKFIGGMNKLSIPDWVPGVGGAGVNIPKIPLLAKGGHVTGDGSFISGEAGPELVTKSGSNVSVTPLSNQEKSQGISGALGVGSGPTIKIENMSVRNDEDIYKIAKELFKLQKNSNLARGIR